jgi:hypothetical protein
VRLKKSERAPTEAECFASCSPSFYAKVGDGCSNPPDFARLIVSGLPSLSDHLMVVRVGAPSDNELRMVRPSAISGTKARVTGNDDFITSHYDE